MKNKKVLLLIISLLLLIIISICCIIIFTKNDNSSVDDENQNHEYITETDKSSDDNKNDENSNINTENQDVSDEIQKTEYICLDYQSEEECASSYYFRTDDFADYKYLSDIINFINIKMCVAGESCDDTIFGKDLVNSADISLDLKVLIAMAKYASMHSKDICVGKTINEKEILNTINTIFNSKVDNLNDLDMSNYAIMCNFIYKYDKAKKEFIIVQSNTGCGGMMPVVETFLVKEEKTTNGIELYVAVMNTIYSGDSDDMSIKAYSDYTNDSQKYIGELQYIDEKMTLNGKQFNYKDYNLQQYKFVFVSNNGNNLLDKIVKVK